MLSQRQILETITSRRGGRDTIANRLARLRARSVPSSPDEQLRDIVMENGSNEVILAAVEMGDVDVLRELSDGYGIEGDDFRINSNEPFRVIATQDEDYDYDQILREMRHSGLDLDDVRESSSINIAASVGNVIFLRALREVFGITDDDVRAEDNAALISAAAGNNAAFLRELRNVYGLGSADARSGNNQALISASASGSVEALRELRFGYSLTTADARSRDNQALVDAVENRNNEVVLILLYAFGLTPRDLEARDRFAIRNAVRTRNQELVRMIRRFQSAELSDDERRIQQESILEEYAADLRRDNGGDAAEEEDFENGGGEGGRPAQPIQINPRDLQPTSTESTTFAISPPLLIDYNYETGKCFDFIAFDEVAAREYLDEDRDNVIMINIAESKALCFTKTRLREIASDPGERFIECLGPIVNESIGEKSQRWIPEDPPLYVKVPSNPESGGNSFIPYENILEAVGSRERIFCIVPLLLGDRSGVQASFSHTITEKNWRQLLGFSYVSSNHCQRGSNILLYKFVRCRFAEASKGPSKTKRRITKSPSPRRKQSPSRAMVLQTRRTKSV